jgi:flagellar protein FlaI
MCIGALTMDQKAFVELEVAVFDELAGKLGGVKGTDLDKYIESVAKSKNPALSKEDISRIIKDAKLFDPIDKYLDDESIEDIMINNTSDIFVYRSGTGQEKVSEKLNDRQALDMLVRKCRMYVTEGKPDNKILDLHLPNGSRANIVDSPLGADITIRNFKKNALSIIDMVNAGEFSYNMAGRLWIYAEGLRVRPANLVIGGMPGSGKTTLLNAMFSFFRPEQRVVVIEDTYEINTETQENCVRLETSAEVSMQDLVKNSLRMRPDMIIVGEVRGEEAKDMMTAMNIGKICMSTIHASTARDVVTRLQHTPMDIEKDIIPLIDAIIIVTQVNDGGASRRKITQVSEVAGIESQVLLSDLYTYDYKTHKSSDILPSVTYRDTLAKLTGVPPTGIIAEERNRGKILEKLNGLGIRDIKSINEFCREYYDNPERAMKKIGL